MKKSKILLILIAVIFWNGISAQENFTIITKVVDGYPVLSPKGDQIVFTSNRSGEYQIYTCDVQGNDIRQLTHKGSNGSPVWSPDGRLIVFSSDRDNDSEIYIMNADGNRQTRLTEQPGDDSHPKFSPDGKRIIFNSAKTSPDLSIPWTSQYLEIFTMDILGKNIKQITSLKSICTYPSFSPDGSKIVFRQLIREPGLNWSLDPIPFNSEIFTMNLDGTNLTNISNNEAYDGWPLWMPDGNTIVFTSNRGGNQNMGQLYKTLLNENETTRITGLNNSFVQASVSNNGNEILAQRNWETETYEYGHIVKIILE